MAFFYAQINGDGIAFAVTQASAAISDHDLVLLSSYDTSVLGKRWTGEVWEETAAPAPLASVVITSITADAAHAAATDISADLRVVDTSVGATLSFTAELQNDGELLPVDQTFRMPLIAADGSNDRRLVRVAFEQGIASFSVTLSTSRHWRVDEAAINQNLQPHEQLAFAGLDVYVLE